MSNLWNSRTNSIIDGVEYKNISLKICSIQFWVLGFVCLKWQGLNSSTLFGSSLSTYLPKMEMPVRNLKSVDKGAVSHVAWLHNVGGNNHKGAKHP